MTPQPIKSKEMPLTVAMDKITAKDDKKNEPEKQERPDPKLPLAPNGPGISPFCGISSGEKSERKMEMSNIEAVQYYRSQLIDQFCQLDDKCTKWQNYVDLGCLEPTEDIEMINMVVQQTRLLLNSELIKFDVLIDRCDGDAEGLVVKDNDTLDVRPIQSADLADFWTAIEIEIKNLEERFAHLERLSTNVWKGPDEVKEILKPTNCEPNQNNDQKAVPTSPNTEMHQKNKEVAYKGKGAIDNDVAIIMHADDGQQTGNPNQKRGSDNIEVPRQLGSVQNCREPLRDQILADPQLGEENSSLPGVSLLGGTFSGEIKEHKEKIQMCRKLEAVEYFRAKLCSQISQLENKCKKWQSYGNDHLNLLELTKGADMINVAIGQTRLLLTKKCIQFKGLIDRCEKGAKDQAPVDVGNEATKPINADDLEGFWALLGIEVDDLDNRFANLERWAENGWKDPDEVKQIPKPQKRRPKQNKDQKPKTVRPNITLRNLMRQKKEEVAYKSEGAIGKDIDIVIYGEEQQLTGNPNPNRDADDIEARRHFEAEQNCYKQLRNETLAVAMGRQAPNNCNKGEAQKHECAHDTQPLNPNGAGIVPVCGVFRGDINVSKENQMIRNLQAIKDFRKQLRDQLFELQEKCSKWQSYGEEHYDHLEMSEATGLINVAVGQTHLLISKKCVKFNELLDSCEADANGLVPKNGTETRKPINDGDLEGFFEIILKEIGNLKNLFQRLEYLSNNNWVEPDEAREKVVEPSKHKHAQDKDKQVKTARPSVGLRAFIRKQKAKVPLKSEDVKENDNETSPVKPTF